MGDPPVTAARWERGAESWFMAEADGWVMVRRPGCIPYTIFKRDWMKLPTLAPPRGRLSRKPTTLLHREPPPMSDLRGLIERVEKATGPERGLDAELAKMIGWTLQKMKGDREPHWRKPGETAYYIRTKDGPPRFTDSVDAALALVEKMRPGYRWGVSSVAIKIGAYPDGKTAYGEGFRAHVTKNSPLRPVPSTADAPTPALAIILALLRSLDTDNKGAAHGAP